MQVLFFSQKISDYISDLREPYKAAVLQDIQLLQKYGSYLRFPYSRKLTHQLFELRTQTHPPIRIIYCFYETSAVLLHAFLKKTNKTSPREIVTALQRKRQLTI